LLLEAISSNSAKLMLQFSWSTTNPGNHSC
jgi:hypothetical protein